MLMIKQHLSQRDIWSLLKRSVIFVFSKVATFKINAKQLWTGKRVIANSYRCHQWWNISRCFALHAGKFWIKETLWQGQLSQGCFKKTFSHRLSSFSLLKIGKHYFEFFFSHWEDAWSTFSMHSKKMVHLKIFDLIIYLLGHIIYLMLWDLVRDTVMDKHTHAHACTGTQYPLFPSLIFLHVVDYPLDGVSNICWLLFPSWVLSFNAQFLNKEVFSNSVRYTDEAKKAPKD